MIPRMLERGVKGIAEKLIGGFFSPNMERGGIWQGGRGYGLYVTTDRIIAVRGGWRQRLARFFANAMWAGGLDAVVSRIGRATTFGELSRDDTRKLIEQLEQKKDFEVCKEDLQQVRVLRLEPREELYWGDVTVSIARDNCAIRVIRDAGEVEMLKEMFTAFDRDKCIFKC